MEGALWRLTLEPDVLGRVTRHEVAGIEGE